MCIIINREIEKKEQKLKVTGIHEIFVPNHVHACCMPNLEQINSSQSLQRDVVNTSASWSSDLTKGVEISPLNIYPE